MMENAALRSQGFEPLPGVNAPSGVYLLLSAGKIVYVGQSKNVYSRMYAHHNARRRGRRRNGSEFLTPGDIRGMAIPFDQVLVKFIPERDLDLVEAELIQRYRPRFNISIPQITKLPNGVKVDIGAIARELGWKTNEPKVRRRSV